MTLSRPVSAPPATALHLAVDRSAREPVTEQIRKALQAAIAQGRLAPGARLPSWRDLASQLGVARGTVRAAYEALIDAQLIVALGAAGTFVGRHGVAVPPPGAVAPASAVLRDPVANYPRSVSGVFQMGVPAQDAFPAKVWERTVARAARESAHAPLRYPDPRGEALLRAAIAAYLAVARGMACSAAQGYITSGHTAAIALAVQALGLRGQAWSEEPGYPLTRRTLAALGLACVPVPVDVQGLDVAAGMAVAPQAALAVVTPGQQAPLGAAQAGAWVLEDDYLGELQLPPGRALPALAAQDAGGRVLHMGTFSKTINPSLRLGFLVVPAAQVARFDEAAALFGSAPGPLLQNAVAQFLQGGHLLRHLRRMKQLYAGRRDAILGSLRPEGATCRAAGLAVLLRLPPGQDDVALALQARQHGLAPVPLSPWYADPQPHHAGLVLGVANVPEGEAAAHCRQLLGLLGDCRP